MPQSHYVHIVDRESQRRVLISRSISEHGLHAEIYESASELAGQGTTRSGYPQQGAILLSDDEDIDLARFIAELRDGGCFLPLIAFTSASCESRRIVSALHAGALDYFLFPADYPIVGDRVEWVIQHAKGLARHEELASLARTRVARLSPRERGVLMGVVNGLTSKEIARADGISPRTVEVHRAAVLAKLEVATTAGAIATGIAAGLLSSFDGRV